MSRDSEFFGNLLCARGLVFSYRIDHLLVGVFRLEPPDFVPFAVFVD